MAKHDAVEQFSVLLLIVSGGGMESDGGVLLLLLHPLICLRAVRHPPRQQRLKDHVLHRP